METSRMSFDLARGAARGFKAGLVATTTMTAAMFALQKAGLLGRMPPRLLTERTLGRFGLRRKTSKPTRRVLTALMHCGFGGTMGAIFEVTRSAIAVRRGRVGSLGAVVGAGTAFGALIWTVSYAGWIPALGLMPRPSKDRPGRPTSMILAHLIFGATLGRVAAAPHLRSLPDEVTV
jgi:hypothetical protein